MAEDLCHHEEHPVAVSGEEILTLMAGGFADQRARQSVASTTERDSSVFGSESVLSVSVHGKTEVDLLSMTWNWARYGVKGLTTTMECLDASSRQEFVATLIEDSSLSDVVRQTRDLHAQCVEQLRALWDETARDVDRLNSQLAAEREPMARLVNDDAHLPSLLSILEGEN